ncbi:MAG: hypothetical protein ABI402_12635 [Ferruginibacter sp.]
MVSPLQRWLRVSLFNLLLVALLGTVLRYKIAFSLPVIDQKHLMHAHSHFAFAGWITMALMALMVDYLSKEYGDAIFKKYRWILYANLLTAYGMLFSFPFEGYGPVSISFSTLSVFANYIFVFQYWKDLNKLKNKDISHYWFKAALLFNAISSLGTYALAIMMVTKNIHEEMYLASVYFFLHFQYNGWFFFACMGLLTGKILIQIISPAILKKIFWLFSIACVPAFFLSALWMKVPLWVYILVILAAFAQLGGWIWMIRLLKRQLPAIKSTFSLFSRRILLLSAIALTLKLLLQIGSTIPSLSTLAYGFRPIVIGYLHLVLLGVISLFIIGYMIGNNYIFYNKRTVWGTCIFIAGVIINEILLMAQGVAGLDYINIPYINESLFVTACILLSGMLVLNVSQLKKK